jgi:uncharacterized protein YsxB (DUF464 family)
MIAILYLLAESSVDPSNPFDPLQLLVQGASVSAVIVVVVLFLRHMTDVQERYDQNLRGISNDFKTALSDDRKELREFLMAHHEMEVNSLDKISGTLQTLANEVRDMDRR